MLLTPARIKLFPKAPALRRIKKSLVSFWVKSCSQIQFASSSKHNLVQTARRRNLISCRQRFPLRMMCPQQSPGHPPTWTALGALPSPGFTHTQHKQPVGSTKEGDMSPLVLLGKVSQVQPGQRSFLQCELKPLSSKGNTFLYTTEVLHKGKWTFHLTSWDSTIICVAHH